MLCRIMMVAALGLALASAPLRAEAQYTGDQGYGQPVSAPTTPAPVPHTEERVHVGMIVSGSVMLGVSWLLHAAIVSPLAGCCSAGSDDEWHTFRWLGVVPVLGPWLQMAVKPGGLRSDDWATYLAVDGILQAGGLTLIILGATLTETVTVYADGRDGPTLSLGAAPGGLSLNGTF